MFRAGLLQQQLQQQASNPLANITTDMVGWWPLNEASGDALDANGSNNMTQVGTITRVSGKLSNAADFDPNEHFHTSTATPNGGNNDWCVAFWFNPDLVANADILCTCGQYNSGSISGYNFSITLKSASTIGIDLGVASVWQSVESSATISAGNWYFCEAYYIASTNTLGIRINNGTPDETVITGTPQNVTSPSLIIGAQRSGYGGFNGKMDEVVAWNRVLTSTESDGLWNDGAGVAYPG